MKHTRDDYSVVQDFTVAVELARLLLSPNTLNKDAIARRLAYEILGMDSRGRATDTPLWDDAAFNKIPFDEPVFLIRAQDACSSATVRHWASLAEAYGAEAEIVDIAQRLAAQMEQWPIKKVPDIPENVRKLWVKDRLTDKT